MSHAKQPFKALIVATLLAGAGFTAIAQGTPPAPGTPPAAQGERGKRFDPAKFKEHMAKRQAELKAKLQISPAQEGAWSAWTTALQPPANRPARPDRAEFAKLTTPERIDRMSAMHTERSARMQKRGEATKTFYAALSAEQKKVFDAETARGHGRKGGRHHRG
jgi:periplasmic protein CpxP/Spy